MATYNLGKFILNPRGTYSSSETYNKLDVVLFTGSSYICKSDNTVNKVPTNTTYWQLLAQAGQSTMTEQQKQDIIQTLLSQGVIIDPDYNTYTTEEKQKLAGLTNPQNGQLTINYDGSTIGTFTANQAGNSSVSIPSPNDGVIKLVNANDDSAIGTFSVNQKEDAIIKIPVGSGGGSANNGTLTIKHGTTTLGTFTADQSTNTTVTIPNNSLTLKQNNTTVGTYTPTTAATLNITVPTNVSDLADHGNYVQWRDYIDDTNNPDSDTLTGDCKISKLRCNTVYSLESVSSLGIDDYEYDVTKPDALTNPVTYIYVKSVGNFVINVSNLTNFKEVKTDSTLRLETGKQYLITVVGFVWRVDELL